MKEPKEKEIATIPVSDYVEGGMYFSDNKELIRIGRIYPEKNEMDIFNLTEQIKYYGVKIDKHRMIKRIR